MSSKKWCIIAFAAALCVAISIALLNFFVNPFGAFGNDWLSYNATNNPRIAKIEYLKDNHQKYDSYIIGCSSTSSYPVKELNEYMNASFYNMIVYGADMYDSEKMVYYLADNYEVKNILLNVYIANGFDYNYEPNKLTDSMHCDVSGESKLSFYARYAFCNPQYSFSKLKAMKDDRYLAESYDVFDEETGAYDKRKRDAEQISDLDSYYKAYPVFADYPIQSRLLPKTEENANSIGRIKEFCDEKGINLIVVNAPVYYDYFKGFDIKEIENYYTAIAEKTDFWDFSISSVSLEPRFFYDETHFRNDVGRMALARIFENKSKFVPEDFGELVTKENVSEYVETFYNKELSDTFYTKKLPVLLYHHIAEKSDNDMTVSSEVFNQHMKAISDSGYTALSLEDIVFFVEEGRDLPEKAVLITFDDGYESNYSIAYPILEKLGLKATVFAVGSSFGKDVYKDTDIKIRPHFGKYEMKEMEGTIDVQYHTYALHDNPEFEKGEAFENILQVKNEDDSDYKKRIYNDVKLWKETVEKDLLAVAFPHGESDLFSQELFNECGIKLSFSTRYKADTLIKGISQSGYNLGRFTVTEDMSASDILNLLKG